MKLTFLMGWEMGIKYFLPFIYDMYVYVLYTVFLVARLELQGTAVSIQRTNLHRHITLIPFCLINT